MSEYRLPVALARVTEIAVGGRWFELHPGTLRKEGPSDEASEWISFETDFTGERVHCRIASVSAFRTRS